MPGMVDTLDALHTCGRYDRIVVVAHSLGSVVAYDMLRACFSRVCNDLPPAAEVGASLAEIDHGPWEPFAPASKQAQKTLRLKAREIVENIAAVAEKEARFKPWLVTDFVTLGSALTHAHYLMCIGKSQVELETDFDRRVMEREFPTCPPARRDDDGLLTFRNPRSGARQFHHGALFGLARWTNLYFPLREVFWGDAIGGPLAPIFGSHVIDVAVSTHESGAADFFTHNTYWDIGRPGGRRAPHIIALRKAIDLAGDETALDLVEDSMSASSPRSAGSEPAALPLS
jgi:hypothetical protein